MQFQEGDWVCYQVNNEIFSCRVIERINSGNVLVEKKINGKMEEFPVCETDCFFLVADEQLIL